MNAEEASLPPGWIKTTLGAIAHVEAGQSPPSSSFTDDPSAVEFLQGNAEFGEIYPKPIKRTSAPAKFASSNAVLLSVRAPVGATNLSPGRIAIGRGLVAVESLAGMDARFLLWLLRYHRQALESQATGTTFRAVTGKVVRALSVALPPLAEQQRITTRLEQLLSRIAAGRRAFVAAMQGCEKLRAAILGLLADAAFPRARIGDIGTVFVGATPSRNEPAFWGGSIPWVSSGEVAFCRIWATRERITEDALGNRATRLHPPGTVLLAMYGEGKTRGQAAILNTDAATNQAVAAVRLNRQRMLPEFLFYCLMHLYDVVRQVGRGGQQINLNGDLVRAIEVPCPPLDTQQELVRVVRGHLERTAAMEAGMASRIAEVERLRQSVLHQAFRGGLVEHCDADEPASQLLSRVRDEQQAIRATGRSGGRARPGTSLGLEQ